MNMATISGGTSILDLEKQERVGQYDNLQKQNHMGGMQYGAMQNLQYEQGHNAAHHVHQAQHTPYYDIGKEMGNPGYPKFNVEPQQNQMVPMEKEQNIEYLAEDISNNLPSDTVMSGVSDIPEIEQEYNNDDEYRFKILSSIPKILIDPIIIVIIYIILSQPYVQLTIGKYIKQIIPREDKTVSFAGVLIYGIILATLFSLIKRFILR